MPHAVALGLLRHELHLLRAPMHEVPFLVAWILRQVVGARWAGTTVVPGRFAVRENRLDGIRMQVRKQFRHVVELRAVRAITGEPGPAALQVRFAKSLQPSDTSAKAICP